MAELELNIDLESTKTPDVMSPTHANDQLVNVVRNTSFGSSKRTVSRQRTLGRGNSFAKPPPKKSKDMRDLPKQAQALSFFHCKFGHDLGQGQDEQKKSSQLRNPDDILFQGFPNKGCVTCKFEVEKALATATSAEDPHAGQQTETMEFWQFMRYLGPYIPEGMAPKDKEKQKGCQVLFPSTCFFREDKIDFIVMNDRDYCIVTKSGKGHVLDIRQDLEKEVRERKNMTELHQVQKEVVDRQERLFSGKSTDPSVMGHTPKNKSFDKSKQKQIQASNDIGILRFRRDSETSASIKSTQQPDIQLIKALSSLHFNKLFDKPKNLFFKELEYVQTCVKHKTGIGEPIHVQFKAPTKRENGRLIYLNRQANVDELQLLRDGKFKAYCEHQCLKMCDHLSRKRGIDVLSMQAEFLKDQIYNVWFSHASQIKYIKGSHSISCQLLSGNISDEQTKLLQDAEKQQLDTELAVHRMREIAELKKPQKISFQEKKMMVFMDDYYDQIKKNHEIELSTMWKTRDPVFEQIMEHGPRKQLGLGTKTVEEYMREETRQVMKNCLSYKRKQKERQRLATASETQRFFTEKPKRASKSMASQQRQRGRETYVDLSGGMDTEIQTGCLMGDRRVESKTSYMGKRYNSITSAGTTYQSQKSRSTLNETPMLGGSKIVSMLKSELVRNNVVTRQNLVQNYKQPLKRHEIPGENPFSQQKAFISYIEPSPRYKLIDREEIEKSQGYQHLFGGHDYESTFQQNTATSSFRGRLTPSSQNHPHRENKSSLRTNHFDIRSGSTRLSNLAPDRQSYWKASNNISLRPTFLQSR